MSNKQNYSVRAPASDQLLETWILVQMNLIFMIALGIMSTFLILISTVNFFWIRKKNQMFLMFCRQILRQHNKKLIKKQVKHHQESLHSEISKNDQINNLKLFQKALQLNDPMTMEEMKESIMCQLFTAKLFTIKNQKRFSQIKQFITVSKLLQSLTFYQPFLIILAIIFSSNIFTVQITSSQLEIQTYQNKFEISVYVIITMIITSLLMFLCLNCSRIFFKLILCLHIKSQKIGIKDPNLQTQSIESQQEVIVTLPSEVIKNQKQHNHLINSGNLTQKNISKIPYKLRNSLNLLNSVYLLALLVASIILIINTF